MPELSRKKKAAFAIVTTLGFLVALEGACQIYFALRASRDVEDAVVDRFHPMRYDLAPGRSLPANGPIARINNVGLRGTDADIPKRRIRILCLGDSATFGYAPDVTDDKTYPAQLGALLETSFPGKFEVLNGGRPSYSTLDCLGFFSYRASDLKPDTVILMMGWNDTHLAHPLVRPPEKLLPRIVASSATLRMAGAIVSRFVKPRAPTVQDLQSRLKRLPRPTDGLSEAVFASNERALEDLARLVIAHDAKPILVRLASPVRPQWTDVDSLTDAEVVVMTPHLIGGELSPGGWARFVSEANAAIDRVGARLGLEVVEASSLRNPDQFVDVCHPNAMGNAELARRLHDVIARQFP